MAELSKVFNEKDLFAFFQKVRLQKAKELNDLNIKKTDHVDEEKRTFKGTFKNVGHLIKRKTKNYSGKGNQIDDDISSFESKHTSVMTKGEAIDYLDDLLKDDVNGLARLALACSIILDPEYEYEYVKEGLEEVSQYLFNNKAELLNVKEQLEDNYRAVSPTALSKTQKKVLITVVVASLATAVCFPALLGVGAKTSVAASSATLASHGLTGAVAAESILVGAAITGIAYGGMKLYNEQKIKNEFKKMDPDSNALYLAIQATHIQRLVRTMNSDDLKEQLDPILKNLNVLKSDLDYYLFVEKLSIKDNKKKIKSFHDFDDRLIKVLGL